ncbi:ribosomal-processing cysteine protease Prp [Clostridium frigidicarnis]|uniref:Ribosomal processing cysteine protease Prp n=1 Tax=Clostridium frigidicarnis TaxID=84698 RepID=A0A1I0YT38_9CLOT|nr:ribosomal-processing cysteine protease Prp [Clostridium frigidicarnis]SFB16464.1 hypothetical protein SAMN04488528_10158 [Clostridium frigidicarnis]
MIKAKFLKKNDKLVAVTLKGHSGYAEEGSDIVCAAATTLSCTIGDGIVNVLEVKANCSANEGEIYIDLNGNSASEIQQCQVLMKTLHLGLKNLELIYGMYIKVDEEEV